ncbi:MAG: prepilin-type N-terminal cleavage/methylation domain-containing protein [Comamonadaceae bacterium]|nr:MAG: prepilin-type N-terminal cleavage/methylation domain-containing protein [Comamonadaceae bacterium]
MSRSSRPCRSVPGKAARGFTLVELLVALSVMALLAVLSWRGLDGMSRAQAQTSRHTGDVLTLQVGLAQWTSDLDALAPLLALPRPAASAAAAQNAGQPVPLDWDGRALRMTRQPSGAADDGLRVVAWAARGIDGATQWLRWESPPLRTRGEWQQAWDEAALWAQNPGANAKRREVSVVPVIDWQVFYFRNDAWTNPLSSDALAATPAGSAASANSAAIPEGVRLVLRLSPGQAISGTVTRDWVRPTLSGGRT